MLTNYTCKYCEICRYDHDMYIMRYVHILRIYISQISMRSAENRYIYIIYIYIYILKSSCIFRVLRIDTSIQYRKFQFLLDVI